MTHPNGLPNGLPANGLPANGQPANAHPWPAARPQAHAPQAYAPHAPQTHAQQDPGHAQGGYTGYQAAAPQPAQGWPQQSASQAPAHAPYQTAAVQPATQSPSQLANYYAQQTGQPQNGGHFGQQPHVYPNSYSQPQAAPAQQAYSAQADNRYAQPAAQRGYDQQQWANAAPAQDPRGYDIGGYHSANTGAHAGQGYADGGYGQHGDPNLDQNYEGHEDGGEYEVEEPKRGSRLTMIAAALVGAIAVGGALAYGYTNFIASDGNGPTPLVKSAEGPSKTKPSDPGGKQFSHSDSKVMGRLGGDGTANSTDTADAGSSSSDTDSSGARKVQTLVVGRDGSITGPAAVVPGMTVVDAFGGKPPPIETAAVTLPSAPTLEAKPAAAAIEKAAETVTKPITVSPPAIPVKPAVVAKAAPATPTVTDAVPVAPGKPAPVAAAPKIVTAAVDPAALKKPAAVAPATAPVSTSSSGNGFVAVLASVPVSASSRLSALKQFADMQQKYGTALQNKQPDVQEANLGDKGKYHRLLAGPPGSREQASSLCGQLKSAGYGDCWVMAY